MRNMWAISGNLSIYLIFIWLLGVCYGFVLLSSAAGQNGETNLFKTGDFYHYKYHSTVLLNEKDADVTKKNVGFYLAADILVHIVWGQASTRLLKFELKSPQLHIRSRKAPSPDGFIQHSSKLEEFSLKPFYVVWNSGKIDKVLLPKDQPIALSNINKGIASLFQFQLLDTESNETDSSGFCSVHYKSVTADKFQKIKTNCLSTDLPYRITNDNILETNVHSSRITNYELDVNNDLLKTVASKEKHQMYLAAKEDLGNCVETDQILTYVKTGKSEQLEREQGNLENVLNNLMEKASYSEESLLTERETISYDDVTFTNTVNELRENLQEKNLGTLVSAKSFIRLVGVARRSKKDDVAKALGSKKNQNILSQLYDVLGYVQDEEIHEVVMKKLHFDKEDHLDLSERYLWSLSMAPEPNLEIVQDLLNRHLKNDNFPDKVKETLILTLASMTNKLSNQGQNPHTHKLAHNVEEAIINGLDYAKDDNRFTFLRALKNLRSPSTIPLLLKTAGTGSTKEAILAFRALKSFGPQFWNSDVLKAARRSFLQLDRKYDSSARTLSIDILLESNPTDALLLDFLHFLRSNDSSFEVKQYVFQRLQMIADQDEAFKAKILGLIKADPSLNNYSTLSPRGLSTALKRDFIKTASVNGSLLTIQEMFNGIVKRGIVNVMMDKNGASKELISLGIFAGGLSSYMSGDSEGDDEIASAGMDLTILDTQIRPFVFFTGQGELMGHVWSGTASERTTAYQALILLQDHQEYLRLGLGFIAELDLKGAMSFDLSGKIEISFWSRTADSLVEKSAGVIVNGLIIIDSSFVRSQVEFSASIEPKLAIKSDIDFSGNMNLCMQVTQPDSVFRHNIFKIERIPGSKHKLRIAKYKKSLIPGTTYSLNKKNNEMCSAMFK